MAPFIELLNWEFFLYLIFAPRLAFPNASGLYGTGRSLEDFSSARHYRYTIFLLASEFPTRKAKYPRDNIQLVFPRVFLTGILGTNARFWWISLHGWYLSGCPNCHPICQSVFEYRSLDPIEQELLYLFEQCCLECRPEATHRTPKSRNNVESGDEHEATDGQVKTSLVRRDAADILGVPGPRYNRISARYTYSYISRKAVLI
ncbi:hypothetical protein WA026_009380 [Henosepilachna vigintioctopunctata]|uniref:Uncharacterized protein n=1 Tax=Henosepilachna vigintioctopunctata TaxID=420089 RepID=A0AAW1TVI6_9CUCU